jgi:hypothetical protein
MDHRSNVIGVGSVSGHATDYVTAVSGLLDSGETSGVMQFTVLVDDDGFRIWQGID